MCFNIDKNHKRRKTAKEDITCYKVMYDYFNDGNVFSSPFRGYKYVLGVLVTSKLQRPDKWNKINKGLHSYSTTQKANTWWSFNCVIVKCIIPKGARYYYSEVYEEYVSNKIIAIKKIK